MDTVQLSSLFSRLYGPAAEPIRYFFAPGRVNLIGEYTDINGGYVFPAAISLGIYGAMRQRPDRTIRLTSTNASQEVAVDLEAATVFNASDGWANYPKGIISFLQREGYPLSGCDILFAGTLPEGAGLSSSAALLVLTAYMLRQRGSRTADVDRSELARFCQRVENQFMGVNCGVMDQFAVARGKADNAILLECGSLDFEYVPVDLRDYVLLIMNTNKKRELTESCYNMRRSECDEALAMIGRSRPIRHLCQATPAEVEALPEGLPRQRARHVVSENARVLLAAQYLKIGDLARFGELLTASHRSLQYDFDVSGPELDAIVGSALSAPGCIGARMTGAGFGGCAIALVARQQAEEFRGIVNQAYLAGTGRTPSFYEVGIADGVKALGEIQ